VPHRLSNPPSFVPESPTRGERTQFGMAPCEFGTRLHRGQDHPTEAFAVPRFVKCRHGLPKGIDGALIVALTLIGEAKIEVRQRAQDAILSLAKTLSDSLRSPEIRQSVHRPKTARLVGGRTTGIVRRWPCTVTPESRLEDGAWAGWAAELDR
jgi:hypothetical protein